jgi:hypothetical protein
LFAILSLAMSCADFGEPPEHFSAEFRCTYHGFVVLRGWLTVDESLEDQLDRIDVSGGLQCDSAEYDAVQCALVLP